MSVCEQRLKVQGKARFRGDGSWAGFVVHLCSSLLLAYFILKCVCVEARIGQLGFGSSPTGIGPFPQKPQRASPGSLAL